MSTFTLKMSFSERIGFVQIFTFITSAVVSILIPNVFVSLSDHLPGIHQWKRRSLMTDAKFHSRRKPECPFSHADSGRYPFEKKIFDSLIEINGASSPVVNVSAYLCC